MFRKVSKFSEKSYLPLPHCFRAKTEIFGDGNKPVVIGEAPEEELK